MQIVVLNICSYLFIVAPNWKQVKCSSTGAWINKLWYIYTVNTLENLNDGKIWET